MAFALTVDDFVASIGGTDRLAQIIGADDPEEVLPPLLLAAEGEIEQALSVADYPRISWPDDGGPAATLLTIHGNALVGLYLAARMPELPEGIASAGKAARVWLTDIRAGRAILPGVERARKQTPRIFMSGARPADEAIPAALY